jgi:hypothetical protein
MKSNSRQKLEAADAARADRRRLNHFDGPGRRRKLGFDNPDWQYSAILLALWEFNLPYHAAPRSIAQWRHAANEACAGRGSPRYPVVASDVSTTTNSILKTHCQIMGGLTRRELRKMDAIAGFVCDLINGSAKQDHIAVRNALDKLGPAWIDLLRVLVDHHGQPLMGFARSVISMDRAIATLIAVANEFIASHVGQTANSSKA